jgi:pyridoxine 4-dehydrogenase
LQRRAWLPRKIDKPASNRPSSLAAYVRGMTIQTVAKASGTFTIGGALTVNRLGFGAMRLTGKGVWGPPDDHDECIRVLRRAVELGVTFIDTADSYGPSVSEELIREALHPYPDNLVIATKAGFVRTGPDQWDPLGFPAYLRQECEMSLRRLGVDRIDLFQLHRIDPKFPAEDQLGELAALQREGKIRHIGLSEVTVDQLEAAQKVVSIVSVQNMYNLSARTAEPVLQACEARDVGFIPWFPLAAGPLAAVDGPLQRIAVTHHATPSQLALAWLLKRSPVMLPIPGTSKVAHLEENVAAAEIVLSDDEFDELSAAGSAG